MPSTSFVRWSGKWFNEQCKIGRTIFLSGFGHRAKRPLCPSRDGSGLLSEWRVSYTKCPISSNAQFPDVRFSNIFCLIWASFKCPKTFPRCPKSGFRTFIVQSGSKVGSGSKQSVILEFWLLTDHMLTCWHVDMAGCPHEFLEGVRGKFWRVFELSFFLHWTRPKMCHKPRKWP